MLYSITTQLRKDFANVINHLIFKSDRRWQSVSVTKENKVDFKGTRDRLPP